MDARVRHTHTHETQAERRRLRLDAPGDTNDTDETLHVSILHAHRASEANRKEGGTYLQSVIASSLSFPCERLAHGGIL